MKKHIARIALASLVTVALASVPGISQAQDASATNAPVIPPPVPAPSPKNHGEPFRGLISGVDITAKTLTVGNLTISVMPTTRIEKDNLPGSFSDITVGEQVIGAYRTDAAGNLIAISLRLGDKGPKDKTKAPIDQPGVVPTGS